MGFFNRKIGGSGDKVFALDLSDLSAKVFALDRDGKRDRVRSFAAVDIPRGNIENGKILEKEKVISYIHQAMREAYPKRIRTKKVICSVPESKAFLRIITIPKIAEAEAQEAVKWEIEASIPLSVDQVYFDWQFLDASEKRQNVLTVAVAKEIIDDLVEVLTAGGLDVQGLEVESVASVRSLVPSSAPKDDVYLIVDFGATKTSFIISEGNIPYFTSSIPFSSEALTDVISKSLGIGKDESEQIKIQQGVERSFANNAVFSAARPLLENLAAEIDKSIDFYKNMSGRPVEIKKIILCGGGSNLRGLIPYLITRLDSEVVLGDPWINLGLGNHLPAIDKMNAVRFATVIGLALRSTTYGDQT